MAKGQFCYICTIKCEYTLACMYAILVLLCPPFNISYAIYFCSNIYSDLDLASSSELVKKEKRRRIIVLLIVEGGRIELRDAKNNGSKSKAILNGF